MSVPLRDARREVSFGRDFSHFKRAAPYRGRHRAIDWFRFSLPDDFRDGQLDISSALRRGDEGHACATYIVVAPLMPDTARRTNEEPQYTRSARVSARRWAT